MRRICCERGDVSNDSSDKSNTSTMKPLPFQVNTQLGEFTLRRHTMETLPRSIENHPDFQAIFGLAEDSSRFVLGLCLCRTVMFPNPPVSGLIVRRVSRSTNQSPLDIAAFSV